MRAPADGFPGGCFDRLIEACRRAFSAEAFGAVLPPAAEHPRGFNETWALLRVGDEILGLPYRGMRHARVVDDPWTALVLLCLKQDLSEAEQGTLELEAGEAEITDPQAFLTAAEWVEEVSYEAGVLGLLPVDWNTVWDEVSSVASPFD
jgi:hypothetical protein